MSGGLFSAVMCLALSASTTGAVDAGAGEVSPGPPSRETSADAPAGEGPSTVQGASQPIDGGSSEAGPPESARPVTDTAEEKRRRREAERAARAEAAQEKHRLAEEAKRQRNAERRAAAEERKRLADEAKAKRAQERRAAEEARQLELEVKRWAARPRKGGRRGDTGKPSAEAERRTSTASDPAAPTGAPSVDAYLELRQGPGAAAPVSSVEEAKGDPRFHPEAPPEEARARVARVAAQYPYFGIPHNGCGRGPSFLTGELLAPFDGLPVGSAIVLRLEDPSQGSALEGDSLAFSGLRRAGKGPDGTWVYCGRGPALPLPR